MPTNTSRASRSRTADALTGRVRIRMYRHGLGDCFLLRLPKDGTTTDTFNILIDCGVIAVAQKPKDRMLQVLQDIREVTQGRLDVVVLTHEHWDHVSGFSTQQAQQQFDKLKIGEVWYAWTEDPGNKLGVKLRTERQAKLNALQKAAQGLDALQNRLAANSSERTAAERRTRRVKAMLRFFAFDEDDPVDGAGLGAAEGAPKAGKTRAAFEYLAARRDVKTRYIDPLQGPIALPGVAAVRVFALGPPQDEGMIKRSSPSKKGQEVYEFAGDMPMDQNLAAAFERLAQGPGVEGGDDLPFDTKFRCQPTTPVPAKPATPLDRLVSATWNDPKSRARRIDLDWTVAAETLALNLDNHTNNTCLVLAFELVSSGKVLLFAADAQVGNWLSWQGMRFQVDEGGTRREVTGPQLLARTVFYKVGHHGSHNATLRAMGLEQMVSSELVAFVPVFDAHAVKSGWTEMPFKPLLDRLRERTGGRVVFSDPLRPAPAGTDLPGLNAAERTQFSAQLTTNELFYEYELST